jgi:hypothetical protein
MGLLQSSATDLGQLYGIMPLISDRCAQVHPATRNLSFHKLIATEVIDPRMNAINEIVQLSDLLSSKAITKEEFDLLKGAILRQVTI